MRRAVPAGAVRRVAARTATEAASALSLIRAGALGLDPPQRLGRVWNDFRRYGPAGAALSLAVQRHGERTALVDELGSLSFAELDGRSNRLANSLRAAGFSDGDSLGILCRNHRGLLDALFAGAKLGARTVLLNTDFAGPQLADVCAREQIALLISDQEFTEIVAGYQPRLGAVLAWVDPAVPETAGEPGPHPRPRPRLEDLIAAGNPAVPPPPRHGQQIVLLTSGTTGMPKGAPREFGTSLAIPGGYLSKIPLRAGRTVLIAAPVFHAWGLLSTVIALALADTVVLRRRADAGQTLELLRQHRCDALVSVPVLLARLVDVLQAETEAATAARTDPATETATETATAPEVGPPSGGLLPALRVVAVSGSALAPNLARQTMRLLGPVLYDLYGSTEVAYATIATPRDLLAAPGTVGRPPPGTSLKLLDADGHEVPSGQVGRIFVGNAIQFQGYTGGGTKEQVAGLMATGDVGHLDAAGRLFVDGRDDDMIISGGENVYPAEIEELLSRHEQILEAALVGVEDPAFGQRLRAFVVLKAGASLDAEEVRGYVRSNLARYKVPREVIFVNQLPRNPAGKVLKRELPSE